MESLENIEVEVLKETVIQGYGKECDIVLTQVKQTYKGETLYKIFSELKYDGALFDIVDYNVTYSRVKSDSYFSKLERIYPEENIISKIF